MHNFPKRIGEERFQAVMEMLVELFKIVGIISGQILSTHGTLNYRNEKLTKEVLKNRGYDENVSYGNS